MLSLTHNIIIIWVSKIPSFQMSSPLDFLTHCSFNRLSYRDNFPVSDSIFHLLFAQVMRMNAKRWLFFFFLMLASLQSSFRDLILFVFQKSLVRKNKLNYLLPLSNISYSFVLLHVLMLFAYRALKMNCH